VPICAWGICFPLSLIPDMRMFAVPSTLSQGGIFFALGVIVYYGSIENNMDLPAYGSFKKAPVCDAHRTLRIGHCRLHINFCPHCTSFLHIAHRSLLIAHRSSRIAHRSLPIAHQPFPIVHRSVPHFEHRPLTHIERRPFCFLVRSFHNGVCPISLGFRSISQSIPQRGLPPFHNPFHTEVCPHFTIHSTTRFAPIPQSIPQRGLPPFHNPIHKGVCNRCVSM
jgi:hypothetical protein